MRLIECGLRNLWSSKSRHYVPTRRQTIKDQLGRTQSIIQSIDLSYIGEMIPIALQFPLEGFHRKCMDGTRLSIPDNPHGPNLLTNNKYLPLFQPRVLHQHIRAKYLDLLIGKLRLKYFYHQILMAKWPNRCDVSQ
ncbi:unannotated protein [freshwater metagenome]|uniref:Unannotated protein n=1 Tax=freshwater metagenome TaxID=449393 RepID=A0A6J6ZI34_9ZZZZ